jgi:hypothetical protein
VFDSSINIPPIINHLSKKLQKKNAVQIQDFCLGYEGWWAQVGHHWQLRMGVAKVANHFNDVVLLIRSAGQ